MKQGKVFLSMLLLLTLAPGCSFQPGAGESGSEELSFPEPLAFYEKLNIEENQELRLLSAGEGMVLLAVNNTIPPEDPSYQEVGINSSTAQLLLVRREDGEPIRTVKLESGVFCSSGVALGRDIYYAAVELAESSAVPSVRYQIRKNTGTGKELWVAEGLCPNYDLQFPVLMGLAGKGLVYSFSDPDRKEFGVSSIQGDVVKEQVVYQDDKENTTSLFTLLGGNGKSYLYYTAVNGSGTFLIGNLEGIQHTVILPREERVGAFTLLEDTILASIQTETESGRLVSRLTVKDFNGRTLCEYGSEPIYRLTSNGGNCAMGIDGEYASYLFRYDGTELQGIPVEMEAQPVLFLGGEGEFLLNFDTVRQICSLKMP